MKYGFFEKRHKKLRVFLFSHEFESVQELLTNEDVLWSLCRLGIDVDAETLELNGGTLDGIYN